MELGKNQREGGESQRGETADLCGGEAVASLFVSPVFEEIAKVEDIDGLGRIEEEEVTREHTLKGLKQREGRAHSVGKVDRSHRRGRAAA